MIRISMAFAIGLISAPVQAQWIHQPTPGIPRNADGKPNLRAPAPKASDGKPDFSGVWTLVPGKGGISQLKPSEMKPWAEALHKERQENLRSDSPGTQCLPQGFIAVGQTKIVQTPVLIVMLSEDLTYRRIFLDAASFPKTRIPHGRVIQWALGRRHAGGGEHRLQRPYLARGWLSPQRESSRQGRVAAQRFRPFNHGYGAQRPCHLPKGLDAGGLGDFFGGYRPARIRLRRKRKGPHSPGGQEFR